MFEKTSTFFVIFVYISKFYRKLSLKVGFSCLNPYSKTTISIQIMLRAEEF